MGKINVGRVVLGGLVAGLVINFGEFILNGLILARQLEDAMRALNKPAVGNEAIAYFVVGGFILGILMIWLYAAIRPRFGAGPRTAICAGLAVWALAYFYGSIGFIALALFPTNLMIIALIWGLVELPIASLAGAFLYKEDS
jgi:FtsH-binding integral membrane protein